MFFTFDRQWSKSFLSCSSGTPSAPATSAATLRRVRLGEMYFFASAAVRFPISFQYASTSFRGTSV